MRTNRWILVAMILAVCSTSDSPGLQARPGGSGFSAFYRFGNAENFVNECKAVEHADLDKKGFIPIDDLNNLGLCYGFIAGVVDLNALDSGLDKHPANGWCVPDDASDSQLAKIIVKFGNDHLEQLHYAAVTIVFNAFKSVFRC